MSNQFYFGEDSSTTSLPNTRLNEGDDDRYNDDNEGDDDYDDITTLPFAKPLDRSSFLAPEFDPATFLSSLSNRFQTLEDLQEELRELSQSLNKELVDLVNDNYADFFSLGSSLAGGEEKIEEVRVGLLGFQRDIEGVRGKVDEKKKEASGLLDRKRELRKEIRMGEVLLEIAERLDELEDMLRLGSGRANIQKRDHGVTAGEEEQDDDNNDDGNAISKGTWSQDWDDDVLDESDDDDGSENDISGVSGRLRGSVERYLIVKLLAKKHNSEHPFLVAQRDRTDKIKNTIRLELENAIREEKDAGAKRAIVELQASMNNS